MKPNLRKRRNHKPLVTAYDTAAFGFPNSAHAEPHAGLPLTRTPCEIVDLYDLQDQFVGRRVLASRIGAHVYLGDLHDARVVHDATHSARPAQQRRIGSVGWFELSESRRLSGNRETALERILAIRNDVALNAHIGAFPPVPIGDRAPESTLQIQAMNTLATALTALRSDSESVGLWSDVARSAPWLDNLIDDERLRILRSEAGGPVSVLAVPGMSEALCAGITLHDRAHRGFAASTHELFTRAGYLEQLAGSTHRDSFPCNPDPPPEGRWI